MKAAAHPRQEARLERLRRFDILDTPRERDFDDIVELASQICDTPISVVNLIDLDRQWFKAEVGLGVRETPLETSLCSHAILEKDYMEIADTLSDDRTCDNPLCLAAEGIGLRFYAGYLLKSEDGFPIGTLCVLDTKPRRLTEMQRNALRVLAKQVMHQLNLRQAIAHEKLMRQEIDHRVKNSLQSIAAYVRQRSRRSDSDEARATLDAVTTRIDAVAALHEQFYRTANDSGIDLRELGDRLEEITAELCQPGTSLAVDLPSMPVGSTKASALSMIISEFVANSNKHAFVGRSRGRISIVARLAADGTIDVKCSDDGVGHDGFSDRGTSERGLGIRIIEAGVHQLGSIPVWRSGAGGTTLSFRLDVGDETSRGLTVM
jgi:two-component sensor histidine kinase